MAPTALSLSWAIARGYRCLQMGATTALLNTDLKGWHSVVVSRWDLLAEQALRVSRGIGKDTQRDRRRTAVILKHSRSRKPARLSGSGTHPSVWLSAPGDASGEVAPPAVHELQGGL